MPLSPAEKQKRYRERQQERLKEKRDLTEAHLRQPFFEFFAELSDGESDFSTLGTYAAHSGITFNRLHDDTDIDFSNVDIDYRGYEKGDLGKHGNSLAKAERMRETFLTGARVLSEAINRYKREEIAERIREIEASDLSDSARKKQALAEVVRLNKLLDRLAKRERFDLPVVEVKG